MKIKKIEKSNLSNIDFDNLTFGDVFTDHMFVCSFKKGEWTNPEIKPYQLFQSVHLLEFFIMGKLVLKE
jgi:branched-chain amino acid aminotransferase